MKLYVVRHDTYTTGTFFADRVDADAAVADLLRESKRLADTDDEGETGWYVLELAFGHEYDLEDKLDI